MPSQSTFGRRQFLRAAAASASLLHSVGFENSQLWGAESRVEGETDHGQTVKIAFAFGQNPYFQMPGAEPSSFLGNRASPLICRHIHSVSYKPVEKAFYACTEDLERGHGLECHWLRDVCSPFARGFVVSPDLGKSWATYDLKELGKRSPYRFHQKNSDGWFRVDLRQEWIRRAEVLFIKPK